MKELVLNEARKTFENGRNKLVADLRTELYVDSLVIL